MTSPDPPGRPGTKVGAALWDRAIPRQLTRIEDTAFLDIGGERVKASFKTDVERTAEDGKTSSVHFLVFSLTPTQAVRFRDASATVMLGFSHTNYGHLATISPEARQELAKDLG